jgi:3-dehydroquinate dehydratase/shikimate dehydrogenase
MGEKGVITRLLAAKYGGYLTFAAMSPEKASAPGQPNLQLLRGLYNFHVGGEQVAVAANTNP